MFDYEGEDSYRDYVLSLVKDFFTMIDISSFRIYLNKVEIIDKECKPYRVYLEEYLNRFIKDVKVDYIKEENVLSICFPKEKYDGVVL